ncbi:MAG: cyclase family protein [Planctomycetota bacterium]
MTTQPNEIIDISVPVSKTLVTWPGDPKPDIYYVKTLAEGGTSNTSAFAMSTHIGTHVDAPLHYIEGATPVDKVPLATLIGRARVVDMRGKAVITPADLEAADLEGAERLLFKTDASGYWADPVFHEEFPHLDDDSARDLVERRVKLIGVDYLSVEQYKGRTRKTHRILLEGNIIIIEGLNLSEVEPGDYQLICLPLRLAGFEAAPARAVLRRVARM